MKRRKEKDFVWSAAITLNWDNVMYCYAELLQVSSIFVDWSVSDGTRSLILLVGE